MNLRIAVGCLALAGLPLTALAAAPAPTPVQSERQGPLQQVDVAGFAVSGNTLLPASQIDAVLRPYAGRRSPGELSAAAQAVQALYRDAGYGAVVVYLPEQALGDGIVRLTVLEGRIARVTVLGNRKFDNDNVRRSVPALKEGRTPQVKAIDAEVQLANENPERRLAVTLEEGQRPGEVDARVNVSEDPAQRWSLFADNTGNSRTGKFRLGLGYQNPSLWNLDHQLTAQLQLSPDHASAVRVFSGSYRVPLYSLGLMVQAYATYSSVNAGTTATAAGALSFNGKGRVFGVLATRLFERWADFEQRVSLSLDRRDYLNNCAIADLPDGACGAAGQSVTVHPLTVEYALTRNGERAAGLTLSASYNLGLGGRYGGDDSFQAARPGARRHYAAARLAAYAALPLGKDWRVLYRVAGQTANTALLPGEQFGLTGAAMVRGYEEREVTGDDGAAATVEVLSPAIGASTAGAARAFDNLRFAGFTDVGWVRNRYDLACNGSSATHCRAAAVGLGMRFTLWSSVWRIDLARAMVDGRETRRGDLRLQFQANLAF